MLSKALEMGVCFHRGPTCVERAGGAPLLGSLKEEKMFFTEGNFYDQFERDVKRALEMGSSLHRGPFGERGRGSFIGTFERKRECVFGFLLLDPEDVNPLPANVENMVSSK